MRAVHLEMVSDLTSEAFIACLHRFVLTEVALIKFGVITGLTLWAQTVNLRDFNDFLPNPILQHNGYQFYSSKDIDWRFIPERVPHFGGLWESTVKSMKMHLKVTTM